MVTALTPAETLRKRVITEFLVNRHYYDLVGLLRAPQEGFKKIMISVLELLDFAPSVGDELISKPLEILPVFKECLMRAQEVVETQTSGLKPVDDVKVHFYSLPLIVGKTLCHRIPSIDYENKLLNISGTVVKIGTPRMIERSGKFECVRCKCEYEVDADISLYGQVPKPKICTAFIDGQECRTAKFNKMMGFKPVCEDYQEIRIQESTSNLDIGAVPRSLTVVLRADLVDAAKAGDYVQIIGVLRSRWKPLKSGVKAELESFFDANYLYKGAEGFGSADLEVSIDFASLINNFWGKYEANTADALKGRNNIVSSFCPQIHGLLLPKLAILLILVGGCSGEENEDEGAVRMGSRRHRREGHILLVGDPGTAKSQLLMGAASLTNRAILTTGSGSTNAGLTVTAVKDGGDWTLEAGALVLADRGICCIDEFNQLKANDRTCIHEAMEQQTISIAKAGLVCKLNTRCSIIAACNSKGKFEEGETISANTALASPLLSRFDLIMVMLDRKSPEWDERLADSILEGATGTRRVQIQSSPDHWDHEILRAYIGYTKQRVQPRMSFPAKVVISKYYQMQRSGTNRDMARTTVRLLESLIRLSQAHAKLMWQSDILLHDAVAAIVLMESSLQTQAILGIKPDLFAASPTDQVAQYHEQSAQILSKLHINPAVFDEGETSQADPVDLPELDEILCSWAPTQ